MKFSGKDDAMLVLTRKRDESILIGETQVKVVSIARGRVKLGIIAPKDVPVFREEIGRRIQREQRSQQDQTP